MCCAWEQLLKTCATRKTKNKSDSTNISTIEVVVARAFQFGLRKVSI